MDANTWSIAKLSSGIVHSATGRLWLHPVKVVINPGRWGIAYPCANKKNTTYPSSVILWLIPKPITWSLSSTMSSHSCQIYSALHIVPCSSTPSKSHNAQLAQTTTARKQQEQFHSILFYCQAQLSILLSTLFPTLFHTLLSQFSSKAPPSVRLKWTTVEGTGKRLELLDADKIPA